MDTFIPDDFEARYGAVLRKWCSENFPQVDFDATVIRFREKAEASGSKAWKARKWDSKFKCIVRNAIERQYTGVVIIKRDRDHDPRWSVIHQARKEGFREPEPHETPQSYASAFLLWKTQPRTNVVDFSKVVKRVP